MSDASTDLHYHKQPHTLDPNQPDLADAKEAPPRAQGHTEDDAGDVAAAEKAHTDQVKAEREQDAVGAREPGDHAQAKTKAKKDS
jgi:hypothetical protein